VSEDDDRNPWQRVLDELRVRLDEDEFRRWFLPTSYASDSGDQITVWVPVEAIRRHVPVHFGEQLNRALEAINRPNTRVRFIVTGYDDDEGGDDFE
jgi:chromosomal replication initiation ATPase DnaA